MKQECKLLNRKSFFSRIRCKLYLKYYCMAMDGICYSPESIAATPLTEHYLRQITSVEELSAQKTEISSQISPEKYKSLHKRFTDPNRVSRTFFIYTPEHIFCGYVELLTEDFFDSGLNVFIKVPPNAVCSVDVNIFKPFRSHNVGLQLYRLSYKVARDMGKDWLIALINEDNPPSLINFLRAGGQRFGCMIQFFPSHPKLYIKCGFYKNLPQAMTEWQIAL